MLVDQQIAEYRFDAIIVDRLKKFFSLCLTLKKSVAINSCTVASVAGILENGLYLNYVSHLQLAFHKIYFMRRKYDRNTFYNRSHSIIRNIFSNRMEMPDSSYYW